MKYPHLLRAAVLAAAAVGAGTVLAQATAPSKVPPALNRQVVSDVAPAPAEDRDSVGAIVVAPVRAQRSHSVTMGAGPALRPINRHSARSRVESDLEQSRLDRSEDLRRRGAAGLIAN